MLEVQWMYVFFESGIVLSLHQNSSESLRICTKVNGNPLNTEVHWFGYEHIGEKSFATKIRTISKLVKYDPKKHHWCFKRSFGVWYPPFRWRGVDVFWTATKLYDFCWTKLSRWIVGSSLELHIHPLHPLSSRSHYPKHSNLAPLWGTTQDVLEFT